MKRGALVELGEPIPVLGHHGLLARQRLRTLVHGIESRTVLKWQERKITFVVIKKIFMSTEFNVSQCIHRQL